MLKKTFFAVTFIAFTLTSLSNTKTIENKPGLSVSSFNQNSIIINWQIDNFKISTYTVDANNFSYIKFTDAIYTDKIAKPEIPYKKFVLGVPDNAALNFSISNIQYENVENIVPVPVGTPIRDKSGIISAKRTADLSDYNFSPAQQIEISDQYYFRKMPMVRVKFYPVSYDYSSQTLKIIKSATINFYFNGATEYNNTSLSRSDNLYNEIVLNYNQAKNWVLQKPVTLKKLSYVPQGPWYKIEVTEDGLYKIPTSTLSNAGIDISSIDPRTLRIYNNGGLPLNVNSLSTVNNPSEPIENAIYVQGESDGSFDPGDYILFYGTELGGWNLSGSTKDFSYVEHPYDTKNYYWLTFGNGNGKRMQTIPVPGDAATANDTYFLDRKRFEKDEYNLLSSGCDWYGHRFSGTSGQTSVEFQINNLSSTPNPAKILIRFKGGSGVKHDDNTYYKYWFTTYLNQSLNANALVPIDNFIKSNAMLKSSAFTSTDYLKNGQNTLYLDYSANLESCIAYLDYFEFYYPSDFTAANNYLSFYTNTTGQVVSYNISGFSLSDVKLFDISDPLNVSIVTVNSFQDGELNFNLDLNDHNNKRLIASSLTSSQIYTVPNITGFTPTRDLYSQSIQAELLIITPPSFVSYAEEIVTLRNSGEFPITGTVVTTEDIFFHFGSGVKDPVAIRNFVRHAYNNWTVGPDYVLLFGDGHYDYRNISVKDTNFIPPFEISDNQELSSRETDNFYTAINKSNSYLYSILPELPIGRLPVESHLDARRVVDKLVAYQNNKSHDGWQTVMTFVADDTTPDGIVFQDDTDETARLPVLNKFLKKKIYLLGYNSVPGGFGRVKPEANNDLINQMNEGTLIVNWIGHGSPTQWAHENIFEMNRDLKRIKNEGKLPFLIAATCSFGKYDDPRDPSFSEALIWEENVGAIAILAASRGVTNYANVNFNQKFYNSLFYNGSASRPLGEAYMIANDDDVNYQKFHLFADPSMRLADPRQTVKISTIEPDTLKALCKTTITGSVEKDSSTWSAFTGGATIIVNDAKYEDVTHGENHYYSVLGPRIFKGEISVKQGQFGIEDSSQFIIPKSIRYVNKKTGRLTVYAWNENGEGDALGYVDTLLFYGTESLNDEEGPQIDISFHGQENFNDGDLVSNNPTLIAKISDENGINLTGEVGHNIELQIDDEQAKDITTFFSYNRDSYADGKLTYYLEDLNPGTHRLTIKAWDNLNNPTEQSIKFHTVSDEGLVLQNVINYPNPFRTDTHFTFQTTQENIDAEIIIKIYTVTGRLIKTLKGSYVEDGGFNKIYWDGLDEDGDPIANGVYPYKLIIKKNNQHKEVIEKLVVLK